MPTINSILVVDNNPVVTEFMRELLEGEGFTVRTAGTGVTALELFRQQTSDLVFVDRIMPEIDGDELCRLLRAEPNGAQVWLVMVSAIAAEDPEGPVLELVDAHIAKAPFATLRKVVLEVIDGLTAGRAAEYRNRVLGASDLYQREVTRELLQSKRYLETYLETTPNGVIELNTEGVVVLANANAHRLLGRDPGMLVAHRLTDVFPAGDLGERVWTLLAELGREPRNLGEDGSVQIDGRYLSLTGVSLEGVNPGPSLVLISDITAQHERGLRAERLVAEKQRLLREVQHRVRNNLSIISGMLQLQAAGAESSEVAEALGEADGRVRSVLKIYEVLYGAADYQDVELTSFVSELCRELAAFFDQRIGSFEWQTPDEPVRVPVKTALPLGLIVNELVTNAQKYALSARGDGRLRVTLAHDPDGRLSLAVGDNGPGLPEAVLRGEGQGFGLELVRMEVAQIGAELEIDCDRGTVFTIRLPR